MSSSDTLTYDQAPPHRPGLDELGGGAKVNGTPAPDPVRQLRAEDVNQLSQQAAAVARVTPVAVLQVDQTAGAYTKAALSCQPTGVALADITVTKNGTGDVSVTWPSDAFPSKIANPRAYVVGTTPLLVAVEVIANGARVRLLNAAGAAADSAFDLDVF